MVLCPDYHQTSLMYYIKGKIIMHSHDEAACVENHFAVQSICDRVLNFDLQPHYQKQTHGTDVMDLKSAI